MNNTKKITISALMVALATVLMWASKIIPLKWLQGGSVTFASMVPIIAVSIMLGVKWGFLSSFVYAAIQMFEFYPPPTQTFLNFVLVIFLDYIIAYGVLGLSGAIYRLLGKKRFAIPVAGFVTVLLRYVCHIISGVLIWGVYAPNGQSVFLYSLIYNGSYMIPEIIITTVVLALLSKFFEQAVPAPSSRPDKS